MQFAASIDSVRSLTQISLRESCHTDTFPLTMNLFVANAEFDVRAGAFALGLAVLTRSYCGETASFPGPIGLEYARAIQVAVPQLLEVGTVNGFDRSLTTGDLDVVCFQARRERPKWTPTDGAAPMSIDWTGDVVDRAQRSSTGFHLGRYFTNFELVSDETTASIAIGLMHAGALCRNLVVPSPRDMPRDVERLREALSIVGITLHLAP
jgi:hypothetical protein